MSANARREAVLALLVSGATIKATADSVGTNEKTIRRWLKEPEFAAELAEARADVTKGVIRSLIGKAEQAITTLDDIMTTEKVSAHAKVTAARTIIEYALKSIETEEIINRIEELEKCAKEANQQ